MKSLTSIDLADAEMCLAQGTEEIRYQTVKALTAQPTPAAAPLLLRAIADPSFRVRESSIAAMTLLPASSLCSLLEGYVRNHADADLRNAALEVFPRLGEPAVLHLVPLLTDADEEVRMFVAALLGDLRSATAVAALVERLADPDENVRHSAAESLGKIGDARAVTALIGCLSEDFWVQYPAVVALGLIGDPAATTPLLDLLGDEMLREPVVEALGRIGDFTAIPRLAELLRNGDPGCRNDVLAALVRIQGRVDRQRVTDGPCLPSIRQSLAEEDLLQHLFASLDHPDVAVRRNAVIALGWLREPRAARTLIGYVADYELEENVIGALVAIGAPSVEPLVAALASPEPRVRTAVVRCLGWIGSIDGLEQCVHLLEDDGFEVRYQAAVALGAGLGSERIEDALVRALHAADDELRATVVEVLSGSLSTRLPGQLVAGLSEWSRPGQLAALRLLGRLGRVDTAGAFLDRLRDPDEAIRAEALRALGRILGGEARMSVLVPGLDDRSPVVRRAAVEGLSGAGGVEVADRLEQLLGDPDEDVRLLVIETLGRLGRRSAVPRLVAELGRGDRRLDRSVVVALGAIGGRESAQFLTELLRTAEPGQQTVILEALGQIGDERTVPAVLVCLGDPDWSVRNAAVKALGQLRAPGSLPHLVERLDDSEDVVRKQAITALGDLGDARASEAILAQVHEPSLQLEAFAALERLGVPDLEAFERYFARGSSRLKGLLVDLLGRIRQRSAGSFLTGALRQEFFTVRARAARALGELGDGAAVAALRQAYREDPSEEVRREVSAALKHLDGAR